AHQRRRWHRAAMGSRGRRVVGPPWSCRCSGEDRARGPTGEFRRSAWQRPGDDPASTGAIIGTCSLPAGGVGTEARIDALTHVLGVIAFRDAAGPVPLVHASEVVTVDLD